MLDKTEIWKRVRAYQDSMTQIEKSLIKQTFRVYVDGNGVEFDSSLHAKSALEDFETAWIMARVWAEPERIKPNDL